MRMNAFLERGGGSRSSRVTSRLHCRARGMYVGVETEENWTGYRRRKCDSTASESGYFLTVKHVFAG